MTRLVVVLLTLTLTLSANITASSWIAAVDKVLPSVVSIQVESADDQTGEKSYSTACSGFTIDEQRQLFMTAAHCRGIGRLGVNHEIAWVVYENYELDLMVLQSVGVRLRALQPRTDPIVAGMDVASIGHAYGFELPQARTSIVSHPYMLIPPLKRSFMVTSQPPIGGQSGGPFIDQQGFVVGIVQMGNAYTGLGKPIDVILKATAAYWQMR